MVGFTVPTLGRSPEERSSSAHLQRVDPWSGPLGNVLPVDLSSVSVPGAVPYGNFLQWMSLVCRPLK